MFGSIVPGTIPCPIGTETVPFPPGKLLWTVDSALTPELICPPDGGFPPCWPRKPCPSKPALAPAFTWPPKSEFAPAFAWLPKLFCPPAFAFALDSAKLFCPLGKLDGLPNPEFEFAWLCPPAPALADALDSAKLFCPKPTLPADPGKLCCPVG